MRRRSMNEYETRTPAYQDLYNYGHKDICQGSLAGEEAWNRSSEMKISDTGTFFSGYE